MMKTKPKPNKAGAGKLDRSQLLAGRVAVVTGAGSGMGRATAGLMAEPHGGEPNLPIDARLIRGDERRPQIRITRFGFELVFLPPGVAVNDRIVSSFKNDLVALLTDGAECAVGVNEAKP